MIISFSKLKIDRDANWVHCDHQHVVVDLLPPHYIHCILVKPPLGRATLMIVVVLSKSCSATTDPKFKFCCCQHWNPSSVFILLMVANHISHLAETPK